MPRPGVESTRTRPEEPRRGDLDAVGGDDSDGAPPDEQDPIDEHATRDLEVGAVPNLLGEIDESRVAVEALRGAGLEQQDGARRVLAEAGGEDGARRAPAHDDDVGQGLSVCRA